MKICIFSPRKTKKRLARAPIVTETMKNIYLTMLMLLVWPVIATEGESRDMQQYRMLLSRELEVLRSVKDRESAEAAVFLLEEGKRQFVQLMLDWVGEYQEILEYDEEKDALLSDIHKNFCYGSTAFAKLMFDDADAALVPQPMTPDVLEDICLNHGNLSKVCEIGEWKVRCARGPGFTPDKPWVLRIEGDARFPRELITAVVRGCCLGENMEIVGEDVVSQRMVRVLVYLIHDKVKYKANQWIDVSEACRMYTKDEQQTAVREKQRLVQELATAYAAVKNAESAEAHEAQVEALWAEWEKLSDAYNSLPSQQRKDADLLLAPALMKIMQEVERLQESDFYGCELDAPLSWYESETEPT